ncbi:hypothetical protein [Salinimicrobium sp. HB62]|uniref:hypothetical protein n=1 Tax=Salinimicrobium sp. HB62 TaxID=3077781 RepID=UPI002D78567D|nr:hypothetical protein [Salinimicrobium sp. HB62]
MKNLNSIIRSMFIASFVIFAASCSDPDEEVMENVELEASLEAEHYAKNQKAKTKMYSVDFTALNGSGVSGSAELYLMGDQLTVTVNATGLEPNMVHPQHIHGFTENKGNSQCPTSAADTNDDGLIDLVEGLPSYGGVLLELYVPVDEFPVADANGALTYERTFTLGETEFTEEGELISESDLSPLQNRTIVLHGMTVDGEYIATLPVACGQIMPAQGRN